MAGERLDFDIFARLREDGFAKAAKAAQGTSGEVVKLAEHLDKLGAKSTEIRMGLKGNKEALAQLDKLQLKMVQVGDKLIDPEIDLKGTAKTLAEISAVDAAMDKLGKTSKSTTGLIGSSGLSGTAGMGALIGAGVALSPVLATVAVGVGAFGLAAAGAVAPIVKAAGATGGLSANMAKLDPEQQKLAGSLLGLGDQYKKFEQALQPEVLSVFSKGIQIAGHLMHDVQPIAQATGKALNAMLGAVDKEFQSGTWQKFFSFMATSAGPDIKLLSDNFVSLMDVLPGLLTSLQPVAEALLNVSDAALKTIGALEKMHLALPALGATIGFFVAGPLGALVGGLAGLSVELFKSDSHWTSLNSAIRNVRDRTKEYAATATAAAPPVFNLTAALTGLTAAMQKNVDQLLTSQGDLIGWRQAQQAATKQLDSNTAGLKGNSAAALANKAAMLQSTQQAQAFAEQQTHVGGNLAAASRVIQDQIHWLQVHGQHSKFATDEIHALRVEEGKLHDIRQQIKVSGSGTWQVSGQRQTGTHPMAARGAFIRTGQPGVDDQLVIAQRGELIVPTPMVSAGLVDHLRGMIPGFAAGGVVSSYSGSVGGMPPWLAKQDAATLRALDVATAAATAAGISAAQAASVGAGVPGPGGGAPAANAALARRLYPPWGSGSEWAAWNAVEMREAGWNQYARNANSGAYGIPQALPPSKMGAAANPPQSNPTAQIRWMIGYIKQRYGDPIGALAHENKYGWYAQGGIVGDTKPRKHVSKQQQLWLDQLARDVKVLHADQDHAVKRRKVLRHSMEIDELWFLTHPNVKKGGIGFNRHEESLSRSRHALAAFNRRESDKEKALAAKITILRDLTGHPKGRMYGGPGVPAPPGDGGAGAGDGGAGGGDTGGGTTSAPTGPPPIPPPPMPAWMVAAGLGGSAAPTGGFTFPGQTGGMAMPEPVTPRYYGGPRSMGGYGGSGMDFGAIIAEIRAMHQGIVGAVGMVAPGTARGFDRSMTGMSARVAGRFT